MILWRVMVKQDLAETIRKAFRKSGMSMLALSKKTGVPYAGIHGLMNGTSDARLSTASKVCNFLGLRLRAVRRGTRKEK